MCSSLKFRLFILLAMLGAAIMVVPAQAQIGIHESVNIPFDFAVGNTQFKSGMYNVEEVQSGMLAISSVDGQQHSFALTFRGDSANRSQQPHLVFSRFGSETFLDKVFLSAANDYEQLAPTSTEKRLAQGTKAGEELSLVIQPVR